MRRGEEVAACGLACLSQGPGSSRIIGASDLNSCLTPKFHVVAVAAAQSLSRVRCSVNGLCFNTSCWSVLCRGRGSRETCWIGSPARRVLVWGRGSGLGPSTQDSRVWCQRAGRDRVFHRILDFCLRHGQALPSWMAALGTNMTVATSAVHEERACPRQPHLLVFHLRRGFTSARPSSWSREGELGGSGGLCAGS